MTNNLIPNNPRGLGEAISIDAWRTPFDGKSGIADVFVDVVFGTGVFGGGEAPVRFRLALRGATVHVNVGTAGILEVLSDTVQRDYATSPTRNVTETTKTVIKGSKSFDASGEAGGSISAISAQATGDAKISAAMKRDKSTESATETNVSYTSPSMQIVHRRTVGGYAFDISSGTNDRLSGLPWDPQIRRMSIADNGMYRTVGDPPEPLIELLVRREQMEIYDVQFTRGVDKFFRMHKNKQMMAVQYLKDTLLKRGITVGDINEPFAMIKIADVSPQEKRIV
jgi:hypothetical protein